MEARVRGVNEICGSADQRKQRSLLMRSRLYTETKLYLNNSNTKWLSIGVTPSSREKAGGIKNFFTDLYLGGTNCQTLALGGVSGFKKLCRQLREINYWQNMFPEVNSVLYSPNVRKTNCFFFSQFQQKSTYTADECIDGYEIERINSYAQPVFKVTKIDDQKPPPVFMAMQTIESILQAESIVIDITWKKFPVNVYTNYIAVLSRAVHNRDYNMLKDKRIRTYNFSQETMSNFRELFAYDLKQALNERVLVG